MGSACLKEALDLSLKHNGGQATGEVSPRVDTNPVCPLHRTVGRGVPMHDDFAEILGRTQELLANPQEVVFFLFIERDPRTHTGMDEEVIAEFPAKRQCLQEVQMIYRKCRSEAISHIVKRQ